MAIAQGERGSQDDGFAGVETGKDFEAIADETTCFHEAKLGSVFDDNKDPLHLSETGKGRGRDKNGWGGGERHQEAGELAGVGVGGAAKRDFGKDGARVGIGGRCEFVDAAGERCGLAVQPHQQRGSEFELRGDTFRKSALGAKVFGGFEYEQGGPGRGEIAHEGVLPGNDALERSDDPRVGKERLGAGRGGLGNAECILGGEEGLGRVDPTFDQGPFAGDGALGFGQLGVGLSQSRIGFRRDQTNERVSGGDRLSERGDFSDRAGELGGDDRTLSRTKGGRDLQISRESFGGDAERPDRKRGSRGTRGGGRRPVAGTQGQHDEQGGGKAEDHGEIRRAGGGCAR